MDLKTSLSKVLKTKRDYLDALKDMDIVTVEDLLLYLPRTHEDLSEMDTLSSATLGEKVTMRGTVDDLKLIRTRTNKRLVTGTFIDAEGTTAEVIWFNQPHIMRMLSNGDEVVLTGKVALNGRKLQVQSPTFENSNREELLHSGRLVPVYPQHDIIHTKWLREKMSTVRPAIKLLPETIPADVLAEEGLVPRAEAIESLHFPDDGEAVKKALDRIRFEEMYNVQINALEQKREWQGDRQERLKIAMDAELIKAFFASLNFTPTDGQKIAIYEILKDMEQDQSMTRLLEGDVGSGKTLVATAVIANVIRSGGQCALMVPTEVLARQHCASIGKTLIQFHNFLEEKDDNEEKEENGETDLHTPPSLHAPNIALLTGSLTKAEADDVRQKLATGSIDLVIGTHALIQDSVQFKDLKLVVVDEQHRFGVMQRQQLKDKGNPHFLSMTATPIPRTLALTAYGHHDLSVLTEKPGNRQVIDTKVVPPSGRKTVELFIDKQIEEGRQVFVICPLIKESTSDDMAEIKNVEAEKKRLQEGFPHRRIAHLHGKMSAAEKEQVMADFKSKQSDILVSTSVIEVGIDVPNATIICMEGSERFGLAQLHQFRGRVGRGEHKSYCFLFTTTPEQARSTRLKAMETHSDGFKLAEIDLQIRGPGELYGFRQSGLPEVSAASLMNPELVVRARRAAEKFLGIESAVTQV